MRVASGRRYWDWASVAGLVVAGVVFVSEASAAGPDSVVKVPVVSPGGDAAEALFAEGKKLVQAKDFAKAVPLFARAYVAEQRPAYVLELARTELLLARHRDAATHFSAFLLTEREPSAQEKVEAERGLATCSAKVGRLVVTVVPEGADVLIDGVSAGVAPLMGPLFVEPGSHRVEAVLPGRETASERVSVTAGGALDVSLTLGEAGSKSVVLVKERPREKVEDAKVRPKPPGGERNKTLIHAGIGVSAALAAAGVGMGIAAGVFGMQSRDEWVANGCTSQSASCREAFDEKDLLHSRLGSAAVWVSLGAVAVGGATAIYALTGKKKEPETPKAGLVVLPSGGAAVVMGRF